MRHAQSENAEYDRKHNESEPCRAEGGGEHDWEEAEYQ
jgi:hypothetical protein